MTEKTIRQRIAEALEARSGPQMSWQEECDESDRQRGDFQEFESLASLLEQIESGAASIERSGEIDSHQMFRDIMRDTGPSGEVSRLADDRAFPKFPKLEVTVNFSREMIGDMILDCLLEQITARRSGLIGMPILRYFGDDFFLEVTSEYFAKILAEDNQTPERDALPEVLVALHEADEALIPRLVEATATINPRAGARLRELVLDALEDPYCRDKLGFLGTSAIADRLYD